MMKFNSKEEVRKFVWNLLEGRKIALFPNRGHIPNFVGVEKTIDKILSLDVWKDAEKVFISPDSPQRMLINLALTEGKEVFVASPRLKRGILKISNKINNLRDLIKFGVSVGFNIPKIDIGVIGSVAVDLKGNRIGKGGGFGDREIVLLKKKNKRVVIITNVHDLQVFDDLSHLMEKHDEKVDVIVTPSKVIYI